jgi:hypothetical protein
VPQTIEEKGGAAKPAAPTGARVIVVPNRLVNVVLPRKSA